MPEVREYDLPGVKTYDLKLIPDERGFFSEALRSDWKELLGEDEIAQVNVSLLALLSHTTRPTRIIRAGFTT
ncbi:hypothetical protein M1O57_05405 [Dehalococcoidia bacterium]|nr:hypothetical protein [Dehalococcoidia bacterium]MCL0048563.1 hypothetical protein [Dehalococcoidia bacterium]MCL0051011.1 hypothetical protein [Dehalococcoidia bacterium]MCL0065174.1 hypothetical protein [Dehalococcoidia bacterium]MCL0087496.1 hypothetical protein [Dehalococcoidia bacterium]